MDDLGDDPIREYTVEIAVTGTWRETLLATDEDEAEQFAEDHLEEALTNGDVSWGDLGWDVVGVSEVTDE